MSVSIDLRVLASRLEKNSDNLLVRASNKGPEIFEKVATAIAAASTLLEEVADDMDKHAEFEITEAQLDEMAALASAFDESGDPLLKKQASVLDEILLSIAAPKKAALESRKVYDDEVNRLREERRKSRREEAYNKPAEALTSMNNKREQAKAVAQQVKKYVPLEGPLQTRYPPDRPGGQMTRITDHVYQDIVTGIIYDYKAGYKTQKGNEIPGGSVENQTRDFGDVRNQGASLFETRQSIADRFASDDLGHLKKYAMGDQIAAAIQVCRDAAPDLLDGALDCAYDDGMSSSDVANILTDSIDQYKGASEKKVAELLKAAGDNFGGLIYHLTVSSLANEKPVKKNSKFSFLAKILKESQLREFEFEGDPNLDLELDLDEPQSSGLELAVQPEISPAPEGLPSFLSNPKQKETQVQPVVPTPAREPAKEIDPQSRPSFLSKETEPKVGPVTPFSNPEIWGGAYQMAIEEVTDKKKGWSFLRLLNKENKDGTPRYSDKEKLVMTMERINQIMRNSGFAGAYEKAEIPEGDDTNYKSSDFKHVTYKDVFDQKSKFKRSIPEKLEELEGIVEPSPENFPKFEGEQTKINKVVNWPKYIEKTGINITDEVANRIDQEVLDTWKDQFLKYRTLFNKFEFGTTKEMPEFNRLPLPVQEKLTTMFFLKEKTPAILEKYPMMLAEVFAGRDVEEKLAQTKTLEDGEERENLLNEAVYISDLVESQDPILLKMYKDKVEKFNVSEDVMSKMRSYVLSSGSARKAEQTLKDIRTAVFKNTIDRVLAANNLPSWFKEEVPTLADFAEKLESLGKKTSVIKQERKRDEVRKKNQAPKKVIDIPTDENGEQFIPIWEMAQPYMEALVEAYKEFPPDMEVIGDSKWPTDLHAKDRDEFMKDRGFVPPSAPIIAGRVSTTNLISSMDGIWKSLGKDDAGNYKGKTLEFAADPLVDAGGAKTLFTDPEEYIKAFVHAKKQFPFERTEIPKEFAQITVGEPKGMPYLSDAVKVKLADLVGKGLKENDIVEMMANPATNGLGRAIPADSLKPAISWMKANKNLQGMIWSMALKGKSADEINKVISEKFPDAQIKPGVIKFFTQKVHESLARQKVSDKSIDDIMESQGFFPPNKELIGNKSTADILKQKGRKNPYQDLIGLRSMTEMQ